MPPSFARRNIGQLVTSFPPSETCPASGSIMPQAMRKLVVLPAPFGPKSPTISPGSTSKSTPSTTRRRPYDFTRPRTFKSDKCESSVTAGGKSLESRVESRKLILLLTLDSKLLSLSHQPHIRDIRKQREW